MKIERKKKSEKILKTLKPGLEIPSVGNPSLSNGSWSRLPGRSSVSVTPTHSRRISHTHSTHTHTHKIIKTASSSSSSSPTWSTKFLTLSTTTPKNLETKDNRNELEQSDLDDVLLLRECNAKLLTFLLSFR